MIRFRRGFTQQQSRRFFAWLVACLVAAPIGAVGLLVGVGVDWLVAIPVIGISTVVGYGLVLPMGPLWWGCVRLMRTTLVPRGGSDAVVGGIMVSVVALNLELDAWRILPVTVPAGIAGGLVYWLVSGRPQPPYD